MRESGKWLMNVATMLARCPAVSTTTRATAWKHGHDGNKQASPTECEQSKAKSEQKQATISSSLQGQARDSNGGGGFQKLPRGRRAPPNQAPKGKRTDRSRPKEGKKAFLHNPRLRKGHRLRATIKRSDTCWSLSMKFPAKRQGAIHTKLLRPKLHRMLLLALPTGDHMLVGCQEGVVCPALVVRVSPGHTHTH